MELENQVISFEFARRLKELNVTQESLFYYREYHGATILRDNNYRPEIRGVMYYSAFTVAELGELLPDIIYPDSASGSDRQIIMSKSNSFHCVGISNENKTIAPTFFDENEANARAMMLIYLIKMRVQTNESNC